HPAEADVARLDLPEAFAAPRIFAQAGFAAVIEAAAVGAHHPAFTGSGFLFLPFQVAFDVDDHDVAAVGRDAQPAAEDLEPIDADVVADFVHRARLAPGQVVDFAVVAAGIFPRLVGEQAVHRLRQLVAALELAVVGQRENLAVVVRRPHQLVDPQPDR